MSDADGELLGSMAEAIESARYEHMATTRWQDLREGERVARADLMRRALATSGLDAALQDMRARAARSDELGRLAAQREDDLAAHRAAHEDEVRRFTAEMDTLKAELTSEIDVLKADLTAAHNRTAAAEARAEQAETTLAAVRAALDPAARAESEQQNTLSGPSAASSAAHVAPTNGDPSTKKRFARRLG